MCTSFVFSLPTKTTSAERDKLLVQLEVAAHRVVKKWRLLAGKPVWLEKEKLWAIDVPDSLETLGRPLVGFTSSRRNEPYHLAAGFSSPLPSLTSAPSAVFPSPDPSLFRHPDAPLTLSDHATRNLPLLNLHATLCTNAFCVGVLLSHGICDGAGMALVLRALNAELHGEEWDAPPLEAVNPLAKAEKQLVVDETVAAIGKLERQESSFEWLWAPRTWLGGMKAKWSIRWEKWWYEVEDGFFYLNAKTVERVVQRVKREVQEDTGGKEWVSSSDIVTAWLVKAAHSADPPSDALLVSSLYNPRPLLAQHAADPSLLLYPHNAVAHYAALAPPTPLPTLFSTSLAALALTFRRALDTARSLPALQRLFRQHAAMPVREWPAVPFVPFLSGVQTHRVYVANHVGLGTAALSIPSPSRFSSSSAPSAPFSAPSSCPTPPDLPLLAFYWLSTQAAQGGLDGILMLQHREASAADGGGWFGRGVLRRARWEALRRGLEKLEKEDGEGW
ncbi:hypothetical protein JCM10207_005571 [Rhodosporidiobolus poonsookiae]